MILDFFLFLSSAYGVLFIMPRILVTNALPRWQWALTMLLTLSVGAGCDKVPKWDEVTGKSEPLASEPPATEPTLPAPVSQAMEPKPAPEPEAPKINSAELIAAFKAIPPGGVSGTHITQVLQATEGLEQITQILAAGNPGIDNNVLGLMTGFPALKVVDVSNTGVDDVGVAHLSKIPTLESIILNTTNVGDTGIASLSSLPNLKLLHLSDCNRLRAAGIAAIGKMPVIEEVILNRVGAVNDQSLNLMCEARTLRRLQMGYCSGLSDAAMYPLRNLDVLEELIIAETSVTGEGLSFAAKGGLKNLKKLDMYQCPITLIGAKMINQCKSLEYLVLGNIGMDDKGLQILTKGMSNLRYLRIGACKNVIGSGLTAIRGADDLEFLSLENCSIVDKAMPLLKGFKKLKTLDLQGTNVTAAAAQSLKKDLPDCEIRTSSGVL
jgi:hypothetical protein